MLGSVALFRPSEIDTSGSARTHSKAGDRAFDTAATIYNLENVTLSLSCSVDFTNTLSLDLLNNFVMTTVP